MTNFDLRKYLKHNPLLKEGVDPFATEEDYAIEYEIDDYEIGDKVMVQPTLTSDPISKQAQIGIVKNVDFEKEVVIVGFDDGEVGQYVPGAVVFPGDEVKQVGSADAFDNMFKGTTPDDINFEGKVKVSELKTRIKEIIKSKVGEGFKDYLGYSEREVSNWPKEVQAYDMDVVFIKSKEWNNGNATYDIVNKKTGKVIEQGGRTFGSLKQLQDSAKDYVIPLGGTQSSQF